MADIFDRRVPLGELTMEIAPINGVRVLPVQKAAPPEPGLSRVFDIALSHAGDDTYSSGSRKGTGGQDDDELDELFAEEDAERPQAERKQSGGISILA